LRASSTGIVIGGLLIALLGSFSPTTGGGGTTPLGYPFPGYHGYVKDDSGNPIAGATVSVDDGQWTTTTGQNGFYTVATTSGYHDVEASKTGYISKKYTQVYTGSQTTLLSFTLVKDSDGDGFRDAYETRVGSDPDDAKIRPTADCFWFYNASWGEHTLKDEGTEYGVNTYLSWLGYTSNIHANFNDEKCEEYLRKNFGARSSAVWVYVGHGSCRILRFQLNDIRRKRRDEAFDLRTQVSLT